VGSTQVPEGYKQTEIGMIPEDWNVGTLNHYWFVTDCKHITAKFIDSGIPVASIREVQSRFVNLDAAKQTTESYYSKLIEGGRKPQGGDLIFSRNATVGEIAQVSDWHPPFAMGQDVCLLRKKTPGLSTDFLQSLISSWIVVNQLENMMVGSTFRRVNVEQIKILVVPMPPLPEQRSIAQALSDVDALIAALEKLIAKNRHLKTATMQQLLTGKMRSPGFGEGKGYRHTEVGIIPEDWSVVALCEIGQSLIGLTYKPENIRQYGTLVLRSSNISSERLVHEDNVYIDSTIELPPRVIVEEGDILICVRNGSRQLIGKCAMINSLCAGSAFGAFMSVFRSKFSKFVFYQFQSDVIKAQINEIMGATINQITNKDMAVFQIPLPPSEEEQRSIAQILSDMDTEIAALENRRAKTQAIKQGMMQELLTGRTRLI
jgi:type I restriction enzyme, S subunit